MTTRVPRNVALNWIAWPASVARLSPLEYQNINFLGQYSFALSETVAQGELRPLRDPVDDYGDVDLA